MDTESALSWIDAQAPEMLRLLESWSAINSYTWNLPGLARMAAALEEEFGGMEHLALPEATSIDARGEATSQSVGEALRLVVRPQAATRVLLNIHYDTVYPPDDPFQLAVRVDADT